MREPPGHDEARPADRGEEEHLDLEHRQEHRAREVRPEMKAAGDDQHGGQQAQGNGRGEPPRGGVRPDRRDAGGEEAHEVIGFHALSS